MSQSDESGVVLTLPTAADVDEIARRIGDMWIRYNQARTTALALNEEARRFVFATDIDQTTAQVTSHKNRTHIPKLTQISDGLQSEYYDASLSMPRFFRFFADNKEDQRKAEKMEKWVKAKLEQTKFRTTVGRTLLTDYVVYGNCFADVDYITETDDEGNVIYRGPRIRRVSPLDVVFNPEAESFAKSPKLERTLMHIADIENLPNEFPGSGFRTDTIQMAKNARHPEFVNDWVEVIKKRGINMDGFGGHDQYFNNDMAEIIVYRGNTYNPDTGQTQRNRVVYVMDRTFVIRDEPSSSPKSFDGMHQAGWRVRSDNLWAQGPLDNLLGMQWRIDHLENLKADVFDLIAQPVTVITGSNVIEPEEGFMPGAVYHAGEDGDVKFEAPEAQALRGDTQIAVYEKRMEDYAGYPPESRGSRTPGEKTAFEVDKLDSNAGKLFIDKARNFERMLETILEEVFQLMLINFDQGDFIDTFNDEDGSQEIIELAADDLFQKGRFVAMGARHWERRNRQSVELQNFQLGPAQDPKIRAHISSVALSNVWRDRLLLQDEEVFEPYIGIKEDARIQLIGEAEVQRLQEDAGVQAEESAAESLEAVQPGGTGGGPSGAGRPGGGRVT